MDIQPFINALLVADPPKNATADVRPDPADIMLAGQDFPFLATIAKGMDTASSDETHGRLAGLYHIYSVLEGEFGELPFGSLDLIGPTLDDQAKADDALEDENQNAAMLVEVTDTFPNLRATIDALGASSFHVGVLVAYCTTWVWLQRLSTTGAPWVPANTEAAPDTAVDPLAGFDKLGNDDDEEWSDDAAASQKKEPLKSVELFDDDDTAPAPGRAPMLEEYVAHSLLSIFRDLTMIGFIDLQLLPTAHGPLQHGLTLHCVYGNTLSGDSREHLLDVGRLADSVEQFYNVTGLKPTVTVDPQGTLHFRTLVSSYDFTNASTLAV